MRPEHNLFSSCPAPAFKDNNIAVFLASDNNFAPLLGVTLASIVANSKAENNYDILVLSDGLTSLSREKISYPLEGRPNFSLRFLDALPIFTAINTAHLHTSVWPRSTYGRLFAQNIFAPYERIVYLDCDVVVLDDVADLFSTDLENNLIAGARDYGTIKSAGFASASDSYYQQVLGLNLEQMTGYINAGVLVMDLKAMRKVDLEASFRELMQTIPKPLAPDQDIINVACTGRIKHLEQAWNLHQYLADEPEQLKEFSFLPSRLKEDEIKSARHPKIIHFINCGARPWRAEARRTEVDYYFWRYARQTLYYEPLLVYSTPDHEVVRGVLYYTKFLLRYYRYSVLAALPFKYFQRKYKPKLAGLRQRLERVRRILG